jgi:hypothetical protein
VLWRRFGQFDSPVSSDWSSEGQASDSAVPTYFPTFRDGRNQIRNWTGLSEPGSAGDWVEWMFNTGTYAKGPRFGEPDFVGAVWSNPGLYAKADSSGASGALKQTGKKWVEYRASPTPWTRVGRRGSERDLFPIRGPNEEDPRGQQRHNDHDSADPDHAL